MENSYDNNTLVSIITPVYNSGRFIKETIESVQLQTYKEWEMILVDDCSTDNSKKIITDIQKTDSRIKYIELKKNSGAAVARNTAIEAARGRYIAFLDSDDIWSINKLEKQINFMTENNYGFSFTSYELIDEDGKKTNKIVNVPIKINYDGLLKNTIIGCLTVIIDRKIIGDFRMPTIRKGQDTATWLKILKKYDFAYGLNENLAKYRIVKGSISSNKLQALKRTWNIYRNIEGLSLIKSIYVFTIYVINAIRKRL